MRRTHAISRPKEAPGTIPGPPTRAAPMFDKMLPYKLGQTMVSNCWGFETICIELSGRDRRVGGQRQSGGPIDRLETFGTHVLSTIIESKAIPLAAYSLATSVQVLRKRPSPSYMARQCGKPESARVLDPATSPFASNGPS
jgi:hypothetical protein